MAKINGDINSDTFITNRNRFNELAAMYAPTSSLTPRRTSLEQTELENLISTFDTDGVVLTAVEANQVINETTESLTNSQSFTNNVFNPSSVSKGWADRATRTYNGQTLVNLLGEQGSFNKDSDNNNLADGWNQTNLTGLSLSDGIQSFTPTAQTGGINISTSGIPLQANNIYYISADVNSDNTNTALSSSGVASTFHSGSGRFERLSLRYASATIPSTFAIVTTLTSGFSQIQVKNCMAIDLTQIYGAGNEPTSAQMELVPFFNNSAHFGGMLRSVGKNLFDGQLERGAISATTGNNVNSTTAVRSVNFNRLKPSTTYTVSANINTRYFVYDANFNFLTQSFPGQLIYSFTTPADAYYFRLIGTSNDFNEPFQLEEGSTNTTFESYQERQQIVPFLRSVSDGATVVRDTFEGNVIIRRTIEDFNNIIKNSDSSDWTTDSALTNTRRFLIDFNNIGLIDNNPSSNIVRGYLRIGDSIINFSGDNSAITDAELAILGTDGIFRVRINRSDADTVDELIELFDSHDVELVFEAPSLYIEVPTIDGSMYAFTSGQIQNEGIVPIQEITAQFPTSQASEIKTNSQTGDSVGQIADRLSRLSKSYSTTGQDAYFVQAFDGFEFENGDIITLNFGVVNTGASTINGERLLTEDGEEQGAGSLEGALKFEYKVGGDSSDFYLIPAGRINAPVEQFTVADGAITRGDFVRALRSTGEVSPTLVSNVIQDEYNTFLATGTVTNVTATNGWRYYTQIAINETKILVVYATSSGGACRIIDIIDETVGAITNFSTASIRDIRGVLLDDDSMLVCYNNSNGTRGVIMTLNTSNNTVSVGSEQVIDATQAVDIQVDRLSSTSAVIHYVISNTANLRVLTISGNTITPGAPNNHATITAISAGLSLIAVNSSLIVVGYIVSSNANFKAFTISGSAFTQVGSILQDLGFQTSHLIGLDDDFGATSTTVYYGAQGNNEAFDIGALSVSSSTFTLLSAFTVLTAPNTEQFTDSLVALQNRAIAVTYRNSSDEARMLVVTGYDGTVANAQIGQVFEISEPVDNDIRLYPVRMRDNKLAVLTHQTASTLNSKSIDVEYDFNGIARSSGAIGDTINVNIL